MSAFLIRSAFTGFALWIATLIVPGLDFVGGSTNWEKFGIVVVVALIFGVVNAIIKPIVQILSIPLYILTLGLIHVVINAFMLEITAWITRNTTHWGLQVDDFFWSAIFGAIVISLVGWIVGLVLKEPA
ncbi:phage holin family protein [Gordonia sp. SID5947]|uniref:phage holin family protein n=1 Tax=Gordonia sp. SID5947 TaxID=2690315 RepID=UPI00136A3CC2|nr:phage holin family protein [Gordonia sp. SID5947]MYR08812.1 phage holin family protein [Gordonia sp. SID5947]